MEGRGTLGCEIYGFQSGAAESSGFWDVKRRPINC